MFTLTALKYSSILVKFFFIWNHHDVLVSSFRFIWTPMLWVYGHYNLLIFLSVGTYFRSTKWFVYKRQIVTSKDGP